MTEPTWKDPLLAKWFPKCSEETKDHCLRQWRDAPTVSCADVYHDLELTWRYGIAEKPGRLRKDSVRLRSLIDAELARGREAVEVLREVEWSGSLDGDSCCPVCENWKHDARREGHAHDCRLARLLTAPKP